MPSKRLVKFITSSFFLGSVKIKTAWVIIAFWLLLVMPPAYILSSQAMSKMSAGFGAIPRDSEAYEASVIASDQFPPSNTSLIAVIRSNTGFYFNASQFNHTYPAMDLYSAIMNASNEDFLYGLALTLYINQSIVTLGVSSPDLITSPFLLYVGIIITYPNEPQKWADYWNQMFYTNNTVAMIIITLNTGDDSFSLASSTERQKYYQFIDDLREYVDNGLPTTLGLLGVHSAATTHITGSLALSYDNAESTAADRDRIDWMTVILVIFILFIVLRSLVAPTVPLITMAPAILLANALLYFMADFLEISSFAPIMVTVLGLGVGVDYSIFIITRFIDELQAGKTREQALGIATVMSGRAIFSSGLVVITGFGALLIPNLTLVRSIGIGVIVAIFCGLLSAFTLLPALLLVVGEKIIWPRKIVVSNPSTNSDPTTKSSVKRNRSKIIWRQFARFGINHARTIIVVAIIITIPFALLLLSYQPSYDMLSMLPPQTDSSQAFKILDDAGLSSQVYGNTMVLSGFESPDQLWANDTLYAINRLAAWLVSTEGVYEVETITRPSLGGSATINVLDMAKTAQNTSTPYLSPAVIRSVIPVGINSTKIIKKYVNWTMQNNTVLLKLRFAKNPMSFEAMGHLQYIREQVTDLSKFGLPNAVESHISGSTATNLDMSNELYRAFPVMLLWIVLTIMVILTFLLGSITAPIRLIITIATSVTWTLGFLVLTFQFKLDAISIALINPNINLDAGLYWIIPPILFCILFGLGMDYDIFITSRIREEYLKGKSNHDAIEESLVHTASVVTTCALIMAGAFLSLWLSFVLILTEIGLGMVFAVVIDATIVRVLLVPAAMSLMDKYNWWPEWVNQRFGKLKH